MIEIRFGSEEGVKEEKSLANKFPEIAKEWHPTKNDDIKPMYEDCEMLD